jgi:glycosyltransferase involved in cell wall biosynthesis
MTPAATDDAQFPRITIVTPSLNQGEYLGRCIESVAQQNYPNLEHFVIDGGSTDGTLAVIRAHEGSIDFWLSAPDGGQSDAINKGLRRASGELVAWLNADDYYLPGAIEHVARAYRDNLSAPFFFGDGLRVSATEEVIGNFFPEGRQHFDRYALLLGMNYILQPATFINRSALEEAGYLDTTLHYGMDSDLWMRLSGLGDPVPVRAVLAATREHETTKTASGSFKRIEELRQISMRYSGLSITPGVLCYFLDTLDRYARERGDVFPAHYLTDLVAFWEKTALLLERVNAGPDGFPRAREPEGRLPRP